MVVGCARSDDMCRAVVLSVLSNGRLRTGFLYHRPAASCTSVERDLHSPKASVRVTGESDTVTESNDHQDASYGEHAPALDLPAGALAR
jgi:hypothetical protein